MTYKLAKKHWDKALDYYFECSPKVFKEARKAVEIYPKWSRPHWLLGTAYLYVPPINVEAATREFREVVRKEPRWPTGHFNLGRCLAMMGRYEEALPVLRQALRMEPDASWTRVELAKCLLKRAEVREAITVLRGKPSLSPFYTLVDAHLLLAETYMKMDSRLEEARAEWEFIMTLDSSIPVNRVAQAEASKHLQETEEKYLAHKRIFSR